MAPLCLFREIRLVAAMENPSCRRRGECGGRSPCIPRFGGQRHSASAPAVTAGHHARPSPTPTGTVMLLHRYRNHSPPDTTNAFRRHNNRSHRASQTPFAGTVTVPHDTVNTPFGGTVTAPPPGIANTLSTVLSTLHLRHRPGNDKKVSDFGFSSCKKKRQAV